MIKKIRTWNIPSRNLGIVLSKLAQEARDVCTGHLHGEWTGAWTPPFWALGFWRVTVETFQIRALSLGTSDIWGHTHPCCAQRKFCSAFCGISGSIFVPCPLDARTACVHTPFSPHTHILPQFVTTKNVSSYGQISPRGQNHNQLKTSALEVLSLQIYSPHLLC